MADVITRFKLETTQYDSKLRDSVKGLKEVVKMAELAGKDFKGFEKNTLEAAKALGTVETGATNSKDKVKELVGAFNDMAKTYNTMSKEIREGDVGKAISDSLTKLSGRIKEAKQELYSLGDTAKSSGGLFGGGKLDGALQVFAGNVMTKIAGVGMSLASELGDAVKQGIELAKQGEGIRIAFERLGRGDILQGLREATHGTVTDLELMKAAVKFNDFKLPISELGTMLAFAQQKAKDTGQSVDYMVDSIVTGLGRKSLMILDNLGLSAAEIKEKMKETGDMTKAVGEIIREQMAKAGEYVETAADRAAQANVSLQNKMEELGRKFGPLQEASNQLWTSMKIGILDVIGGPLTNLLNKLTEAGRLANQYGVLGGNAKVGRMTSNLANASEGNRQSIYQQQQEQFWRYINPREQQIKDIRAWQSGDRNEALHKRINAITDKYGSLDATKIQAEVDAAKKMISDYQQAAKTILQPIKQEIVPTFTPTGGGSGKGDGKKAPSINDFDNALVKSLLDTSKLKEGKEMMSPFAMMTEEAKKQMLGLAEATEDLGSAQADLGNKKAVEYMDDIKLRAEQQQKAFELAAQSAANLGNALAGIQDPGVKAAGTVLSAIANLVLSFSQAAATASSLGPYGWIAYMGAGTAALATTISTVHSLTGYQKGGMVKGYAGGGSIASGVGGGAITGTTYSNDQIPIMANAGEVILNKAQQATLAQNIQNGGSNLRVTGVLQGTNLLMCIENTLISQGKGQIATWKS